MLQSQAEIRQEKRAARAALSSDQRNYLSAAICRHVVRSAPYFRSKHIGIYLATADEVDTRLLIQRAWNAGKQVYAPVVTSRHDMVFLRIAPDSRLEKSEFGIWEPVDGTPFSPRNLDAVIAPLVAFDDNGNRIGMAGGYYDRCFRFLKTRATWQRPKLLGVAFECQKALKIRPNHWDIPLSRVFTESG